MTISASTTLIDQADFAIELIAKAAEDVCIAMTAENAALRARDDHKDGLVVNLVGTTNEMTNKPHSATSAADAAEHDATYRTLDDARKARELDRIRAQARYEQAKHRARLAIVVAGGGDA